MKKIRNRARPKRYRAVLPLWVHDLCIYCGEQADSRDHYLPWSRNLAPYWLPSCVQCNNHLTEFGHRTLGDRCLLVNQYLYQKYRIILTTDYKEVLTRVEGTLLRRFREEQRVKAIIEDRLKHSETFSELFSEIHLESLHEDKDALEMITEALESIIETHTGEEMTE